MNAASNDPGRPGGSPSAAASRSKYLATAAQQPVVDVDGVPAGAQVRDQLLGVWQRGAVAEGAAADLEHVHAEGRGDEAGELRQPEGGVRVQLEGLAAERRLDGGDQRPRPVRGEDARRVLDVGAVDVGAGPRTAAAMPA